MIGAITAGLFGDIIVAAPKATGGTITSDSTYWYHTFTANGTFTPLVTLSCDALIVAGGAGGGGDIGGGGGAGGLRTFTALSLSTAQGITIGGGGFGGPSSTNGGNGSDSSAFSYTSTGGGYGARYDLQGGSGGSGVVIVRYLKSAV